MKRYTITAFILLCGLWAGGAAKADLCSSASNLIVNCGFETGDLTGWTGSPTSQAGNWYGVDSFDAFTGNDGAYIAGFGSINAGDTNFALLEQSFTTLAGQGYTFTYYVAHNTSGVTPPPNPEDDIFLAGVNGVAVPGTELLDVGSLPFTQYTSYFFATSTSTNIEFEAEDANFFFSLDDVSVTPGVPEPASWLLVGPTLGGLLVLVRRGRRSA